MSERRESRRFARDVRRTIAELPEDEDALLRVEAALRASPGFVGAPPLWRLFRRPQAHPADLPQERRTKEQR
ncbi:hypothetical protein ABCS02_27755 [Microbacterium sp. X-17]|uniref:hypothetical protein n=1 Tax=Microbacterium sp. X-17 TaxID=3144404 RepID=UPI0031F48581